MDKGKRGLLLACAALCLCMTLSAPPARAAGADTYQAAGAYQEAAVVGYYAGWAAYQGYTPDKIPTGRFTHINYAFAAIDPAKNAVVLTDPATDKANLAALRALRDRQPGLKLLISVGGWDDSTYFSDIASTAARRTAFARSCVDFVLTYGLDGVDLDWEYPVSGGASGTTHRPQDKQNFTLLLQEIRNMLDSQGRQDGKTYCLTIAGGADRGYLRQIEPAAVAELVDYVFLMAYDYTGRWDSRTGLNAPLSGVEDSVDAWLGQGVPPEKLVLGMPLYGWAFQGVTGGSGGLRGSYATVSSASYDKVVSQYLNASAYRLTRHEEDQVPSLYGSGRFVTYDDPQSIAAKAELARDRGLLGVGFWELSQDRQCVLVQSAADAFSPSGAFSDVSAGDWFAANVLSVWEQGWMDAAAPGLFAPLTDADRGTLVTALYRMAGASVSVTRAPFPDVAAGDPLAPAVAWAVGTGIVTGCADGLFHPELPITREQLAALLYRYAQYTGCDMDGRMSLSGFPDSWAVSAYARTPLEWAVFNSLIRGRGEELAPGGTASRGEIATLLLRFSMWMEAVG